MGYVYVDTKQIYVEYVASLLTFVPANLLIQDKIWIFNILYYSYSGLVTRLTRTQLYLWTMDFLRHLLLIF